MGLRSAVAGTLLVPLLAGCGSDEPAAAPGVGVRVGGLQAELRPTQYCLGGEWQRYDTRPPVLPVAPDSAIRLTVPDAVAEHGWGVQVFDQTLEEKIGEVDVDEGRKVFDGINTSDIAPSAFYLVVVEDKGGPCGARTGAWPVGFVRAAG